MNAIEPVTDPAFRVRAQRDMQGFGGDFAGFVPERAGGASLYDAIVLGPSPNITRPRVTS